MLEAYFQYRTISGTLQHTEPPPVDSKNVSISGGVLI